MFRWLFLCAVAVALAASQVRAEGGAMQVPDTGLSGVYTDQVTISDHPHHVLVGHVIVATRDGDTVRALVIHQRRDGVHRLRFREAWAQGVELPYRSTTYQGRGCTHGHCRDNQVGMILLSAALFDRGQTSGLTARLAGPSGAMEVAAPARLFRDAAARATASGLLVP